MEQKSLYMFTRRFMDLFLSILGLIITLPIMLITMLLIVLESPGLPIFTQERVGLNGKTFKIYKLRSMRNDAEKNGPQWASKNDARVTKVGQFIRKTRIDELPQLFNVIRGDMSIIGPRPERPVFVKQFNEEIPGFNKRLLIKPGLTGWAQVNGGYECSPEEKLTYDIYYIKNMSYLLDVKIVFRTVKVILTGEGAR
ncbi:sugar transferase [Fredinandcohnia sp. QZ13]|uniref:sugar transferase n=1 Tax=Fredinandcohnia sp. QZ13 TaxID=3073144 RepID=UPI0028533A2F|nr:sugar transferase [Fredinandcohnia sp. QZ13]MDR4890020.1 sugar transferase [Fredinandcohnia sp. QZ13]